MVWIVPADEDDAGNAWGAAIAEEWHKELSDVRQDIYTLADGEPLHDA
jgi:predicted NodU family carbamoyl transferase